jgi:hypothetical protein
MSLTRTIVGCVVGFAFIWVTDFLIHGVWLASTYETTKELWRTEGEMVRHLPFMFGGQAFVGVAFAILYATFVAEKQSLPWSLLFGLLVAAFYCGNQSIMYCVAPYPGLLVAKWCLAGAAQLIVLSSILWLVFRSSKP